MNIRKMLLSNKKLYPFILSLKSLKDNELREKIWGVTHDANNVVIQSKGEELPGKIVYNIEINDELGGFFALMRWACTALLFAEEKGFIPYVRFGEKCRYFDKDIGDNAFEYYFKPVSELSSADIACAKNVINYEPKQLQVVKSNYSFQFVPETTSLFSEIWKKYIRLNDKIESSIQNELNQILDASKKTLAVHVRGTDFKKNYNGHPTAVAVEEEIEIAQKMVNEFGYEQIFLATDEEQTVQLFRNVFGERVKCFGDTFRSTDGTAIHDSDSQRKNHRYYMGYEVLRDVYALAHCDGLLAGVSNVSFFAILINGTLEKKYDHCHICYHGMNKNSNYYKKRIK